MSGSKYLWKLNWFVKPRAGNHRSEGKGKSKHCNKPQDSYMNIRENACYIEALWPTLTSPARSKGGLRDHVMPGWRSFRLENSWDHSRGPLMNMQTQIDLFPLGMSYYSQILIRLQIPPVSTAFPTPLQARTLALRRLWPRNGHKQKRGYPGPHRAAGP
jgi:hypothetical protein